MNDFSDFFKRLDQQFEQDKFKLNLDEERFKAVIDKEKQIKAASEQKKKDDERKQQELKNIANNTIQKSSKLLEETPENRVFLDYFNNQMRASVKEQENYTKVSREINRKEIESLETLQKYTYEKIIEAKARRTTAELTNDLETRTNATSEINKLEKELSEYTERLNELLKGDQ